MLVIIREMFNSISYLSSSISYPSSPYTNTPLSAHPPPEAWYPSCLCFPGVLWVCSPLHWPISQEMFKPLTKPRCLKSPQKRATSKNNLFPSFCYAILGLFCCFWGYIIKMMGWVGVVLRREERGGVDDRDVKNVCDHSRYFWCVSLTSFRLSWLSLLERTIFDILLLLSLIVESFWFSILLVSQSIVLRLDTNT